MILLLLPAMSILASCLVGAPLMILGDECPRLPVVTCLSALVVENIWLSSEILPVVSVDTLGLVMLLIEWAPFSLKVKHVEI